MKKIISVLTIVIVLFIAGVYAYSGDYQDGYNAGYNDGYSEGSDKVYKPREPNIIFSTQDKIPEVNAGSIITLLIDYQNDSEYTAKSIKISPVFEGTPLVYERPIIYESNASLRAKKTNTATFTFKTKEDAKNGVYPISFKITYKNSSDENFSRTATMYIKIIGEKLKSLVTISNISTNPEQVTAGQKFVLSFDVNNIGEIAMSDTSLKLTGLGTDGFMPANGTDSTYIGKISPKASVTKSFEMIASDKIAKGSNSLGVSVQYKDENDEKITEEKSIYIFNVMNSSKNNSDDNNSKVGKPKIIVESYSTMPNNIVAGDSFVFNFKFKNTSRDLYIKNMKVTISSTEGAFMIANGSNTFYVESIAPQASITNSIKLNVKQDLASKSYPINIAFDYEDDNDGGYQSTEVISIPVVEYSNLVINNVMASEGLINQQTSLSFDYINMGKAIASNLTASVEGDYTAVQSINYIGNVEAGNSDYYDIQVTPTKEGENFGILILTFEDSSGKKIEVRKDFTGYAMSEPIYNEEPNIVDPDISEEKNNVLSVWQYIGIGFGSFIVSFLIAKIITTKIIRKKLEDEI